MAVTNIGEQTQVSIDENFLVTYEKKRMWFFGATLQWWRKLKAESLGKDLVVKTTEKYEKVIINDKEYQPLA